MPTSPRRGTSIERDNPFRPGGEIEKEAEDILRNSTISGERVSIIDPSSPQYKKPNGSASSPTTPQAETSDHDQVVVSLNASTTASPAGDTGHTTQDEQSRTTPNKQSPNSEHGNGHHTATNNNEVVDGKGDTDNQTKKKKKKQKTCQII